MQTFEHLIQLRMNDYDMELFFKSCPSISRQRGKWGKQGFTCNIENLFNPDGSIPNEIVQVSTSSC